VVVGRLGLRERAVVLAAEVLLADTGEEPGVSLAVSVSNGSEAMKPDSDSWV